MSTGVPTDLAAGAAPQGWGAGTHTLLPYAVTVEHPGGWGAGTHTLLPYALMVETYSVRFYFKYAMLRVMRVRSSK